MTAALEVLFVDATPAPAVVGQLTDAGHTLRFCFPDGTSACRGIEGTCPLDEGVDVAIASWTPAQVGAICAARAGVPVATVNGPSAGLAERIEATVDRGWGPVRDDIERRVGWTLRDPENVPAPVSVDFAREGRRLAVTIHGPAVSRADAQAACTRAYDALREDRRSFAEVRVHYTSA